MKTLLAALFSVAAVFGQVIPGRYVVELAGSPAALAAPKQAARLAARETDFQTRRAAVRQAQAAARRAVANLGGAVLDSMDTVVNALIVSIPDNQAPALAQIPGVVRVHQVHRVRPLLDHALPIHKVPAAWNSLLAGPNSAGAGIKIGMVDSGIDVHHPGFSVTLPPVNGFPKALVPSDLQFTNSKIIVAKNYTTLLSDGGDPDADDHDGHGTGTSMTAAGGPAATPYGTTITGVAPQAYLGSYKAVDGAGFVTSDVVAKAVDEAVADGMDIINISIGGPVESYSDISSTALGIAAIEGAANAGVIVTASAGNDGPGAGTIADYASAPDAITAGAMQNDRVLGYSITTPGVPPYEAFLGDGPNPGKPLTGPLFDVAALDPTGLACSPLAAGSVTGKIVLIQRGTCTFESKLNNAAAGGATAAIVYNSVTGDPFETISVAVGAATLPAMFTDRPGGLDLQARLTAAPGLQVTLDFGGATAFPLRTDLTSFTSRGPSLGSAMKPDLVAVGDNLITAAQRTYSNGASYDGSGFIDTAGTSFSAPLTAGAAAVLKAARPGLSLAQYRSLLINTAAPATASATAAATVQQAGAGVLNLAAALNSTLAVTPTALNFGTGPGAINSSISLNLTNLGTAADTYTIAVEPFGSNPVPAANVFLAPGVTQQIPVSVNLTGVAPGEYQGFLIITAAANPTPVTVPYWFAVPGSAPTGIALLWVDDQKLPAGQFDRGAILFRVVDLAGLPFSGTVTPTATIASGTGTLRGPYPDPASDIPNTWAVDVRPGSGTFLEVDITVGSITQPAFLSVH